MVRREVLDYVFALNDIRASPGGSNLSPEAARLFAFLIFMPHPDFNADPQVLERAARLGTLNQVDRRAQYQSPQHSRPEALLEAVNVQGNHIRGVQKDVGRVQHDLYNLKLRNSVVVAVVTAFLMRAPEIFNFFYRLSR